VRKNLSVLWVASAAILACCVSFLSLPAVAQEPPPPAGQAGPGAQRPRQPLPKIVNLKVLPKNTPAEEVMRIMRGFEGQLGVECKFCHVRDEKTRKMNFASDVKPEKTAARVMMGMTHEINSKYLKEMPEMHHEAGEEAEEHPEHEEHAGHGDEHAARVTCGTCHRGHSHPEAFVPPPSPDDEQGPHNQHRLAPGPQK
jgi:hypothetical protein